MKTKSCTACKCVRIWLADHFENILVAMIVSCVTATAAIPFYQTRFIHVPLILIGLWGIVIIPLVAAAVRGTWEKLEDGESDD